ncbi:neuferricin [Eucyclogobius newberryi]|uniref:neuferricin n=1 Tax=Eucyclogobius newberryi TaxID=166745 RepID=UPI003B5B9832
MFGYLLVAFLSALLASIFIPREWSLSFGNESAYTRLINYHELSYYDGTQGSKGLYLALLGQIFDVSKGAKHYGPGGSYHFMTGKDASLSFITGDFTESGLTDDVSSVSPLQLVALYEWLSFYHREYQHVGFLIGRYYTESGEPTETLLQTEASLAEGRRLKAQAEAEKTHFPPCNSEWSGSSGGRFWCSTKSGGVERKWTGVPRQLYTPGSSVARCVCVENPLEDDPNVKKYEGCPSSSVSCLIEHDKLS